MRHAPVTALILALVLAGCSGGKGKEGDTGTDTADDTADDTAADTSPDTVEDTEPDTPEDTGTDTPDDTGDDTPDDTGDDTPDDPVADTPDDPGDDPGDDAADDADADTPADSVSDPSGDPGSDPACADPCYVGGSYVTGCTADCGGYAGTPCPDTTTLTCVYPTSATAGICIPTASLPCTIDAECTCFPHTTVCTTSRWRCSGGSCVVDCI